MSRHNPANPDTKAITSSNSSSEQDKPKIDIPQTAGQADINDFLQKIAWAIESKVGNEMPGIEVPRRVIEHYNKMQKSLKAFDEAGYFVYQGVRVYEEGKREEVEARERLTMEQLLFGGKKS